MKPQLLIKAIPKFGRPVRNGVVLILMAVLIPVLLIIAGFAINLSYMELARTDLQVATDAASRAACRTFGTTANEAASQVAAKKAATMNPVLGKVLTLRNQDIVFGRSTRPSSNSKYVFTPGGNKINSVQVDFLSAASGSINLPMRLGSSSPKFAVAQRAVATQSEVDIVLVVDRSGSMAYAIDEISDPIILPKNAPPGWNFNGPVPPLARWTDALAAVSTFLANLSSGPHNATVGVVTYSHFSNSDLPLTSNFPDVNVALSKYNNPYAAGATNIGDGIYSGLYNLSNSSNRRSQAVPVIILLTDGIQNYGPDPVGAATEAANQNVLIYTITFSNEAAQAPMINIANIAKGKHYHTTSVGTLKTAFSEIASNLPILLTD